MTGVREAVLVARFRRGLLTLAASAAAGTALELAMLRHWNGVDQLVPWATLVMVAAGIAIVAFSGARAAVLTGRAIGCGSAIAGVFGVYEHIASNYEAGPLDFRYADRWATMSMPARVWAAASGTVGPSPALAPAILALAGACLLLATFGLPSAQVGAQETISREQDAQDRTNRTSWDETSGRQPRPRTDA